ncbi:MAG: PspA/IM30 family protein [Merismopediaceae bacterium]|nr:PspA/IM30 family protein [Merismopediaceae bacterium]
MGFWQRVGQVMRSQVSAFRQEMTDPEQLLTQMLHQMELNLIEMRRSLAEAIALHKSTERQLANQKMTAQKWYERAKLALDQQNEIIARESLEHRQAHLTQMQNLEQQLTEQKQVILRIKNQLPVLEQKYSELKGKKSLYVARLKSAIASQQLQEMLDTWNPQGTQQLFERLEEKILTLEAQRELSQPAADPLEQRFLTWEETQQVEATLKELKNPRSLPPE